MVGAVLGGAALVSTDAQAQTATTADPAQTSTGAQAQTAKTAGPAAVSTGVPMTMATIADPTPVSAGAQAQTTTTAKPKPKHKKPKPVLAQTITTADPPPVSTDVPITLGPLPSPPPVFGEKAQGCCEGGSATGANAWTTGNATSADWPATSIEPVPYWWTHGEIEVGGRGFVSAPARDGSGALNANVRQQGGNLAKYYEYSDIAPGAFGGGHVATGSKDGLYQVDLWANNIGYLDQSILLNASKAGEQYLSVGWDQSPHLYSTTAQTPYLGVGGTALTLPPGALSATNTTAIGVVPFLHQTDIGIKRDTASGSYRWTPTEAWDFDANYSHMDRTGTQAAGVVGLIPNNTTPGAGAATRTSSSNIEVPAPVDDTTQNFGANGEYAGTSPWGQKFTFKATYNGSLYDDHISNYTVQNPYCTGATAATCAGYGTFVAGPPPNGLFQSQSPFATISTPPSNAANGFGGTLAADLPMQSRYVGTFNYTMMTQNAAFQPMTDNPSAFASPFAGGLNWNQVNFGFINGNLGAPTSSLNGKIDTLLSNNVLTTKITPELTSKLTYRYYGIDNDTPRIEFPCWISVDQTGPSVAPAAATPCGSQGVAPAGGSTAEKAISSLNMSYIKQDAGTELNWRPSQQWNFNAAYGFERYNYTQTDYNITNENSGKLSADWKPTTWFTVRASGYFADRRYDIHNYQQFVQSIQFPTLISPFGTAYPVSTSSWFYSPAYQQFMFDNRLQTKANIAVDIVAFPGVTVTPSFKYQDDDYGINPLNQEGINYNKSTSTGVDVGWVVSRDLSMGVSYYYEYYHLNMYNNLNGNGVTAPIFGNPVQVVTFDQEVVNTVTAMVNWAAVPDKLNFDVRYMISQGLDAQACLQCSPAYPKDTTLFERLDATATYKFDPIWYAESGFKGDVKAKLRYTWERNSVNNWQNDSLAPFTASVTGAGIWLASVNPNYNVQMLAASLIASW